MNNKIKTIIIGFLALGVCSNVFGYYGGNPGAGFYVGGQVGGCNLHYRNSDLAMGAYSVEDKGWAGRLTAGFDINRNVALELGYTLYEKPDFKYRFDRTSSVSASFSQQSLDFLGKVSLPISCNVSLFAEGGLAYVHRDDLRAATDDVIVVSNDSDNHIRPMLGIGVSYAFNARVSGNLAYFRTFGTHDLEDADFYGAGVTFRIG